MRGPGASVSHQASANRLCPGAQDSKPYNGTVFCNTATLLRHAGPSASCAAANQHLRTLPRPWGRREVHAFACRPLPIPTTVIRRLDQDSHGRGSVSKAPYRTRLFAQAAMSRQAMPRNGRQHHAAEGVALDRQVTAVTDGAHSRVFQREMRR